MTLYIIDLNDEEAKEMQLVFMRGIIDSIGRNDVGRATIEKIKNMERKESL